MVRQAESFARRVIETATDDTVRIGSAYQIAFGRDPGSDELAIGLTFLDGCDGADEQARWAQYAQILLASNEMLMVD